MLKKVRKGENGDEHVPILSIWDEEQNSATQVQGLSMRTWDRAYDAYEDIVAEKF